MYNTYLKTVGASIPEQEHSGNSYHKVVIFTTKIGNYNTNNSKLLVVTIPEKWYFEKRSKLPTIGIKIPVVMVL